MRRTCGILFAFALAATEAGCSSSNAGTPSSSPPAVTSVFPLPIPPGYITATPSGLHVWGRAPETVQVIPVLSNGKRFIGQGGPAVTAVSSDPSRMTVKPGSFYAAFVLSPATVAGKGTCPSCRVVRPGTVMLNVTVAQGNGNGKAFATSIAVTIAHKIVAVALNPLPNPSIGGSDVLLQYYDDNSKPSVIWDDVVRKNISSIPNVTGVAYGADGTLYVSNSGVSGVANGTVTEYPAPSTDPVPVKTLSSPNLKSAAGVAVDASGNVYVADNGFETVSRFPTNGRPVTIRPGWSAGADVNGVAVDSQGNLYVAMTGVGNYQPTGKHENVGTLAILPAAFASDATPKFSIESSASNGVNQPYGVAVGEYAVFVVNDYVSIVQGPPGPGPIYSTLTRYEPGIATSRTLPDGTASAGLAWPLGVATDLVGNVYVANNTPPSASGQPGPYYLLEYPGTFVTSGAEPASKIDLSAGLPSVYAPYYLNIQGIAVYPTATTK